MNIWVIIGILFLHWFLDFVLQTDEEAKNKSTSWKPLLEHVGTYTCILWLFSFMFVLATDNWSLLFFAPITGVTHLAIDYYTSRVNKQLWESGNIHGFFVSVGFDQFLHVTQLLLTFYLLNKA